MRHPRQPSASPTVSTLLPRPGRRFVPILAAVLCASVASTGCNMFAGFGAKARGTANTLGKRNVDFDRRAPAEKDLETIHTVAVGAVKGGTSEAQMVSGYLSSFLSESERFTLVTPESLAKTTTAPTTTLSSTGGESDQADPASTGAATVEGNIVQSGYDERVDSKSAKCGDKTCTMRTRIGVAAVKVDLRMVDVATGAILIQKTVEDRQEQKTSATNAQPPSIDGNAMLDEATKTATSQFFAAVSPHIVGETVFFETDTKAKSLKEGANRALGGDLEGALEAFEEGLGQAKAKADEKAIAKAHFDLGLALVINGEYERGLELLHKSQRPKSKKAWADVIRAAEGWKTDADRAEKQWKLRSPEVPAFTPSVRESQGATKKGLQSVGALQAVTGS